MIWGAADNSRHSGRQDAGRSTAHHSASPVTDADTNAPATLRMTSNGRPRQHRARFATWANGRTRSRSKSWWRWEELNLTDPAHRGGNITTSRISAGGQRGGDARRFSVDETHCRGPGNGTPPEGPESPPGGDLLRALVMSRGSLEGSSRIHGVLPGRWLSLAERNRSHAADSVISYEPKGYLLVLQAPSR
jgi:hypothetical protein